MTDPTPPQLTLDHVRASARFLGLPLDEDRLMRVAVHLERTRLMVAELQALPLHPELEPAEIYRPAPFPADTAP
jgi:hypothetical protein